MPNFGDIIILAVIGLAVFLAVRVMRNDRKKGGCAGCSGGNCSTCGH